MIDAPIAAFIGAGERSVDGWTAEHPDVTAAVLMAGAPGATDAASLSRLGALVARQSERAGGRRTGGARRSTRARSWCARWHVADGASPRQGSS
jgi:hypothetical protein